MTGHTLGLGFHDRHDGGQALAHALLQRRSWNDPVVLALPRGGVPVAFEVAKVLDTPLDVLVVRKIGHPRHEEYAIGAIASGGVTVMNAQRDAYLGDVRESEVRRIVAREEVELARREALYREGEPARVEGRDVILVDDGLATGATMRAAVKAVRQRQPASITVAVPVGAAETCDALRALADDLVCIRSPEPFRAVGLWYAEFPQTSDEEVHDLLARARRAMTY
jgi:predicted phosphoribosyltransferase